MLLGEKKITFWIGPVTFMREIPANFANASLHYVVTCFFFVVVVGFFVFFFFFNFYEILSSVIQLRQI